MNRKIISAITALLLLGMLAASGALFGCKISNGDDDGQTGIFEDVSVAEAYSLIQENMTNSNFVILDVRTGEEFDSGHIERALNIDFYASDYGDQLDMLDKDKVYLVYCRSSNRSGQAMDNMEDLGFTEVYNMSGGISAWDDAGYAIVQ